MPTTSRLNPPEINFNLWFFGLNFPVLVISFLLLCRNSWNALLGKRTLARQPYWLYYLHIINILAQSLAYSLFFYELHLFNEFVIVDGEEFQYGAWQPSFVSWIQATARHMLVFGLGMVNFEILSIFSVFSSFLSLETVKRMKWIFLSIYVGCLIYPTICDITILFYFSAGLPSLYSPRLYAILEFSGCSFLVLQDNVQNLFLFYALYKFTTLNSTPALKKLPAKSLVYATLILVAILAMDYLSIGMGIGLLLWPGNNTLWQLSPITAFLGIHALLLDLLFKVFKGLVGCSSGGGGRKKNVDEDGTVTTDRFALEEDDTMHRYDTSLAVSPVSYADSIGRSVMSYGSADSMGGNVMSYGYADGMGGSVMHPQMGQQYQWQDHHGPQYYVQGRRRNSTFRGQDQQPVIVQLGHPHLSYSHQYYH